MIKCVSDLRQVSGFLWVPQFSPPIKLTDILLKGALNTIKSVPARTSKGQDAGPEKWLFSALLDFQKRHFVGTL